MNPPHITPRCRPSTLAVARRLLAPGLAAFACVAGAATQAAHTDAASATAAATRPVSAALTPATRHPATQAAVERAHAAFLATQPFKRLNLSVWVQDAPGQPWRGGEVAADEQVYPASIVKLPFAIDSAITCVERGQAADCQRDDLVPMVVDSDNVATGRLVDGLTRTVDHHEAPLLPGVQAVLAPSDVTEREATYARWLTARRHTEQRLESLGLLGGMRLFSKTYPTNSGEEPMGFEARARRELGRNTMSAHDAAKLLRALVDGDIDRATGAPVLSTLTPLLLRSRFTLQSALSAGIPPGTRQLGKMGSAYDTLEDVVALDWPQRDSAQGSRRIVIAAFSDGLDQTQPEPFDGWRLGGLTALLLQELGLAPAQAWRQPDVRRPARALWQFAPEATTASPAPRPASGRNPAPPALELQYRFPQGAAGVRRVRVHCSPGCQPQAVEWAWTASLVAARPLWLGQFVRGPASRLTVEVELESPTASAGEVLPVPLPAATP